MITDHTPETLRAFEQQIADDFNAGKIRAPIHLSGGCEEQLIGIFQDVREQDWILTTWRSHYHSLLKGVPPERLREDILAGRSITLCYPEYRVISSAIVGGVLPIAVGIAMAINRERATAGNPDRMHSEKVWIFIGDMTSTTGTFAECYRYVCGHDLPVHFVVEDNGRSVCTDTASTWGIDDRYRMNGVEKSHFITRFCYDLPWPHSGAGKRVEF